MFLDQRTGIPPSYGAGNPPIGAAYSRFNFVEEKNYLQMLKLKGQPYNEDEINELQSRNITQSRRNIFDFMGDGSTRENEGFKIEGIPGDNDFAIKGGVQAHPTGTSMRDAGRIFVDGFQIAFYVESGTRTTFNQRIADINYSDLVADAPTRAPDGLPTTPVATDRTDEVYLEFDIDEITNAEDTDLQNPEIGINTVRMAALNWRIRLNQGGTTPETSFDGGTKLWTYRLKLAVIERFDGVDEIAVADVTDFRLNRWWREHGPSGEHLLGVPGFTFDFFQNIIRAGVLDLEGNYHIEYEYDSTTGFIKRWRLTDDGSVVTAEFMIAEGEITYDPTSLFITTVTSWIKDTYGFEQNTAVKVIDTFTYDTAPPNLLTSQRVVTHEDHTFYQAPFDF